MGSQPDGTVSWRSLQTEAERALAGVSDSPAIDARRIVERASGHAGAEYVLGLDELVTERGVHFFDLMLERRIHGEPLQYVVGAWGFRHLDLLVDRRVLIPRPETESVVEVALTELDSLRFEDPDRVRVAVDLGTGSGAIGLSIAQERDRVEVWLTDASTDALDVARANLAGLGRAATRVTIAPAGEWFAALPTELRGRIDLIVSNPPYVADSDELPPVVRDWEPASALFSGVDGLDDLRTIVSEAPSWLAPGAVLVVELAPTQAAAVAVLFGDAGFVDVAIHADLSGRERCVTGRLAR
jgi:release factor glutamine methyltransferase